MREQPRRVSEPIERSDYLLMHATSHDPNIPAISTPRIAQAPGVLRDQLLIHREKAIIWTMFPAEQVYIGAALVEANIDAKSFMHR